MLARALLPLSALATMVACASEPPPATSTGAGGTGGVGGAPVDAGLELGGGVTVTPSKLVPGGQATIVYRGALADRPSVTLHYGFDGWNSVTGVTATSEDDGTGNLDFYVDRAMDPIVNGFTTTVAIPESARALHFVFRAEPDWDNADGQDYGLGIPFPLIGPYLTWKGDPSSSVVVSFHTGFPCRGEVRYGELSSAEPDETYHHHIALTGLPAASDVSYSVACGPLAESATHTFRTLPPTTDVLRFAVVGDMQDDGEHGRWRDVAAELARHDVAFLVLPGDLPWNDRPGLWWTFFDRGRELLATKVMMPAPGNHDTPGVGSSADTTNFERYFPLDASSASPTYYAFGVGHAAFMALNSERPSDFAVSGGVQHAWVSSQLRNADIGGADWLFAFWHIPPYNAGARHWSEQGSFRDLTAMFDGAVDWVFCGHEHLYQRMLPLRYNAALATGGYGREANQGVGYLIVPPAGVWPSDELIPHDDPKGYYRDRLAYPQVAPPSNVAPSEVGFIVVELNGKTLSLTTWGMGTLEQSQPAHIVDQLSQTKP